MWRGRCERGLFTAALCVFITAVSNYLSALMDYKNTVAHRHEFLTIRFDINTVVKWLV
jgi:hypothetical protein